MNRVEISGLFTSKLPVLSNARMKELFESLRAGDASARERLVNGNLKLVLSVIKRFSNRGEFVDDLFQVGCIGLMKAIDNFDLSLAVRFSTYAVPMIIGEIRRYLRDNNAIRVSRSLREIAYKSMRTRDYLASKYLREPTISEIAGEIGIPREEIVMALDASQAPVSLFEPAFGDESGLVYVMDQVSDEKDGDERWLDGITVHDAMSKLSEREKHILLLRFFQGKTQMEVASMIGISQAQVSRLEKAALRHLRKHV